MSEPSADRLRTFSRRRFIVGGAVAGVDALLGVRPAKAEAQTPSPGSSPKPETVTPTSTVMATVTPDPVGPERTKVANANATLTVVEVRKSLEKQASDAGQAVIEGQATITAYQNTPTFTPNAPATATESAILQAHRTEEAKIALAAIARRTPNAAELAKAAADNLAEQDRIAKKAATETARGVEIQRSTDSTNRERADTVAALAKEKEDQRLADLAERTSYSRVIGDKVRAVDEGLRTAGMIEGLKGAVIAGTTALVALGGGVVALYKKLRP